MTPGSIFWNKCRTMKTRSSAHRSLQNVECFVGQSYLLQLRSAFQDFVSWLDLEFRNSWKNTLTHLIGFDGTQQRCFITKKKRVWEPDKTNIDFASCSGKQKHLYTDEETRGVKSNRREVSSKEAALICTHSNMISSTLQRPSRQHEWTPTTPAHRITLVSEP